MIVLDASPIITLGKVGRLHLIRDCFRMALIPTAVWREIMRKPDSLEASSLRHAIEKKWVRVEETEVNAFFSTDRLGSGEKEALSLARDKNVTAILDDDLARTYARELRIQVHGTLFIILVAFSKNIVDEIEAIGIVDRMIDEGFFLSTKVYARFLRAIGLIPHSR